MTALHCAGCGCEGRAPTIVWDRTAPQDPRPVVKPTFGYYPDRPAQPALLCTRCRDRWLRREVLKPGCRR